MNKVKIIQINTGKGKQATALLSQKVLKDKWDIILIQEPYKGTKHPAGYNIYKNSSTAKTKIWIRADITGITLDSGRKNN